MIVYEVFLKREGREEFRNVGALEAPTDELATVLARESYARRAEGDRLWIVRRCHIIDPGDGFVSPNTQKPHRHHDGAAVAERRRLARENRSANERSTPAIDSGRAPHSEDGERI